MLALGLERGRQTVQDQVGIEFSDDADVETLHSGISFFEEPLDLNRFLQTQNIGACNARGKRREAIGGSTSDGKREHLLKRKTTRGREGQSGECRITAAH